MKTNSCTWRICYSSLNSDISMDDGTLLAGHVDAGGIQGMQHSFGFGFRVLDNGGFLRRCRWKYDEKAGFEPEIPKFEILEPIPQVRIHAPRPEAGGAVVDLKRTHRGIQTETDAHTVPQIVPPEILPLLPQSADIVAGGRINP